MKTAAFSQQSILLVLDQDYQIETLSKHIWVISGDAL